MKPNIRHIRPIRLIRLISLIGLIGPIGLIINAASPPATARFNSAGFAPGAKIAVIEILLDSEVPLNAYDVALEFDPTILAIDRVDTSNSLITIWQEPVAITNNSISARGASVKPFQGESGLLLKFYARAKSAGSADINFVKVNLYQADGQGTRAAVAVRNAAMRVDQSNVSALGESKYPPVPESFAHGTGQAADTTAPLITLMRIEKNPFEPSERLLIFSATDESSSIAAAHARVRSGFLWGNWQEAISPHPVTNSAWAIQLKAIDGAGNETIKTIYQYPRGLITLPLIVLAIIIMAVFISKKWYN